MASAIQISSGPHRSQSLSIRLDADSLLVEEEEGMGTRIRTHLRPMEDSSRDMVVHTGSSMVEGPGVGAAEVVTSSSSSTEAHDPALNSGSLLLYMMMMKKKKRKEDQALTNSRVCTSNDVSSYEG